MTAAALCLLPGDLPTGTHPTPELPTMKNETDILAMMAGDDDAAIADPSGEPTNADARPANQTSRGNWRHPEGGRYVHTLVGTYTRLRDGAWGARVIGDRPLVGDQIVIVRQSGARRVHVIATVNRAQNTRADLIWICRLGDVPAPISPSTVPTRKGSLASQWTAAQVATIAATAPTVREPLQSTFGIPAVLPATGPETFNVSRAAERGDLVAGASAEGNGILTGFSGRGTMTRPTLLATLAVAGFPADWAPVAKTRHAHAGRILNALNQLGYVARADTKRRKDKTVANVADAEMDLLVAADSRLDGQHYRADRLVRRAGGVPVPTWAARWEVAAGGGRSSEVGAAFGTVIMVATLDQAGELHLECDNEALTRRVREDFQARVDAEEFQAADVTAWLQSMLTTKFKAARLGGNWYVRRQYAADAERLLKAFSLRWGKEWMLPALPVATTEQLCEGLALGLVDEARVIDEDFEKRRANGLRLTSAQAENMFYAIKSIAARAWGLVTVIGEERAHHLTTVVLAAYADKFAKEVSKPLQRFASIAASLAPRR